MGGIITPEEFYKGMYNRIENLRSKGVSNCIGTGLYIAKELPVDSFIFNKKHQKILGLLTQANHAELGFPGWHQNHKTYHLGIITGVNPTLVTHRDGRKGPLIKNAPLGEVDEHYGQNMGWVDIKKFVPRILEKSLRYPQKWSEN